jgi:hypothetical protein
MLKELAVAEDSVVTTHNTRDTWQQHVNIGIRDTVRPSHLFEPALNQAKCETWCINTTPTGETGGRHNTTPRGETGGRHNTSLCHNLSVISHTVSSVDTSTAHAILSASFLGHLHRVDEHFAIYGRDGTCRAAGPHVQCPAERGGTQYHIWYKSIQ